MISWGKSGEPNVLLEFNNVNSILLTGKFGRLNFTLPFTNAASVENVIHCIMVLLHLGYTEQEIQEKIDQLRAVPMRLELKQGINQCQIIDDTYNNDLGGLRISLDFLEGIHMSKKTLILSDVLQSGLTLDELSQHVYELIKEKQIQKFIAIGFGFHSHQQLFDTLKIDSSFYLTTEDFLKAMDWNSFAQKPFL